MFALAPKYDKENDKTKEAKYTHIRAFRKYAELAQASYCLQLQVGMGKIPNDTKFINALIDTNYDQHFTRDRAIQFVSIYEVIAHYTPKQTEGFFGSIHSFFNDDGFSATLFQDKESKEYILAIRGTEGSFQSVEKITNALKDFYTDFLLATNEIPNQYFTLIDFFENEIKHLIGNNKIVVTGHSLGGFLAQSFVVTYPHITKEAYTYNAPGLLPDDRKLLNESIVKAGQVASNVYDAIKSTLKRNPIQFVQSITDAYNKIKSHSIFSDKMYFQAIVITKELKEAKLQDDSLYDKNKHSSIPSYITDSILEPHNYGSKCQYWDIQGIVVASLCSPFPDSWFSSSSRFDVKDMEQYARQFYAKVQEANVGDILIYNSLLTDGDKNIKVKNKKIIIVKQNEAPQIELLFANIALNLDSGQYRNNTIMKDNISHIQADNDSDPSNNSATENLTADLGEDIAGYKYYINLGKCEKTQDIGSHSIVYLVEALKLAEVQTNNNDRSLYDINTNELERLFCDRISRLSILDYKRLDYYAKNNHSNNVFELGFNSLSSQIAYCAGIKISKG